MEVTTFVVRGRPAQPGGRPLAWALLALVWALTGAVDGAAQANRVRGTRVRSVAVERGEPGTTVVTVLLDGPVVGTQHFRIGGAQPREVLRIGGIVEAYQPYEVAVDDGRVLRIRIGHHPDADRPEENLVFDLADPTVTITRVTHEGDHLTVVLAPMSPTPAIARGGAAPTETPPVSTPPARPAMPEPTPTPRLATSATPTPAPPSATPTALAVPPTPPATASPTPSRLERRPSAGRAMPPAPSPAPQLPTGVPRPVSTPRPHRPGAPPTLELTELVIAHRQDGSTLLRVTVDGPLESSRIGYYGVKDNVPRNVLAMAWVEAPGDSAVLEVRDASLCEVQVLNRPELDPPRTELVLFLASPEVRTTAAAAVGPNAVVRLEPPADPSARRGCDATATAATRSWRFSASGPPQEQVTAPPGPTPTSRQRG